MGLKVYNIDFSQFSNDLYLRCDFKYNVFIFKLNWNVFNYAKETIKLRNILKSDYNIFEYDYGQEYKGIPTGESYIDEDGYIKDFQIVTYEEHPNRIKYKISNNNLLISSIRLAKSPALLFENINLSEYVFSNGFYIFSVNNNHNIKFILYLLRTKIIRNIIDNYIYRGIGISSYKKEDLLNMKIPLIDKQKQNEIVSLIEPIENKIKSLKETIIPEQKIINEVFAREFGFDENLYNEFGKGMTAGTQIADNRTFKVFNTDFADFSKSDIMRFSTRFHNTPTKKLMNILNDIDTIKVKNIIFEYEKGIQPNYNTEGEIQVIKIQNLKNSYIDFNDSEYILEGEYNLISDSKKLKYNDIILCVTGKISLGKIDLYSYEEDAITTVDNFIIRITNYNKLFFVYFFRSILGYFQIERDFTGTTNQIHLRWKEIENFKIPNITLKKQQEIVDEIDNKIKEQQKINIQIEKERNKIYDIINSYIN
ncbi:hypothetical protein SZ52_03330 [Brachyspira hyodysenteriae]|uniref:restriction endonuclease subunit S n=1 Tax=Brachyspira hyodysenteriae TaxID=159 RepID=UPI00063DD552|nr:restriction endonuclease subunit S [Brachyspira hyodysenteriae]KLI43775.1 hypothetical protein SZ52_03330 [Brachyspira hyodysenteriae]